MPKRKINWPRLIVKHLHNVKINMHAIIAVHGICVVKMNDDLDLHNKIYLSK